MTPWVERFAYPVRWYYTVLDAAEYVRRASMLDGSAPDGRMTKEPETIRHQRRPDGIWLEARRHPGRVWFEVDVPGGAPSPWLTRLGTRVLAWWDAALPA